MINSEEHQCIARGGYGRVTCATKQISLNLYWYVCGYRVLPREIAQAVMVPTTLVSRSLVRDVGKELPRVEPVVCMSFRVD